MKELFCENEFAEYWIEKGIIFQIYKLPVSRITIDVAQVVSGDLQALIDKKGESLPLYVETSRAYYMDRDASRFFSEHSNVNRVRAIGVLLNNPAAILGAKLFKVIHKPKIKMEFFSDRTKALNWLEKYKIRTL